MGGANGSRECAPDDKLRDTHPVTTHAEQADGFRKRSTHPTGYGLRAGAALMTTSMRLAENGREGNCEDLRVEIVGDIHDPVSPVFGAPFHEQRSHQARCRGA